jgi:geranylgeranyl reductase
VNTGENIKDAYDVIIVGAGPAGLECAKNLCGSNLDVLIVEKSKIPGEKVCAGGVTFNDLEYIPKGILNFPLNNLHINYKKMNIVVSSPEGLISSVDKVKLACYQIDYLKKFKNIQLLTGIRVTRIISKYLLELSSGKQIKFKFLVGADGSVSVVRRYLRLPVNKLMTTFQYTLPKKLESFQIFLDDNLFGMGYLWIFPHKNYTLVGCGNDLKIMNPKTLKSNFKKWLMLRKVNILDANLKTAFINYDYRGYKFGNIFLTGDSAGLASGITGKGIYAAFLSGTQVARDILQKHYSQNLIEEWLKKKKKQEKYIHLLKNPVLRKFFLSSGIKLLSYKKIQKRGIQAFA